MPLSAFEPTDLGIPPILIYGENGAGKTHLACTFPGKKGFIDYNGNLTVTKKFPQEPIKCIKGPARWADVQSMWTDPIFDDFDVIILDNLTGMYRALIEDVIKSIPVKSGEGSRPSPEIPILRDYGLASERLRFCVNMLLKKFYEEKNKAIIAISHTKTDKDELTGAIFGGPSLPGQVPAYVLSLFTEVIYLKNEGRKHTAKLRHTGIFPATTRILTSAEDVEEPNLKEIYFEGNKPKK